MQTTLQHSPGDPARRRRKFIYSRYGYDHGGCIRRNGTHRVAMGQDPTGRWTQIGKDLLYKILLLAMKGDGCAFSRT